MNKEHYKFSIKPLPYDYGALEPYIDAETVYLHHDRHLQTYVDNLNNALEKYPALHTKSLVELLRMGPVLPADSKDAILNNAGGVYNHNFYFSIMGSCSSNCPSGELKKAIDMQFKSFENFKDILKSSGLKRFGSGWAWLVMGKSGTLRIMSTPNQSSPVSVHLCPIIALDVWEHAYYLKYQNRRADYIDNWFNTINWEKVNEYYSLCLKNQRTR